MEHRVKVVAFQQTLKLFVDLVHQFSIGPLHLVASVFLLKVELIKCGQVSLKN
jgi:hypothetical protein